MLIKTETETGMDGISDRTIKLVVSGYGAAEKATIAGYQLDMTGSAELLWHAQVEQASFVCRWEDYLFTVTEADRESRVHVLRKEKEGYTYLDEKRLEGGALCHIAYSPRHRVLYGACYSTGTVFGVRVEAEGFGDVIYSEIQQSPCGGPLTRAHCVLLNTGEDRLITVNIALDEIIVYELRAGVPQFLERLALPEGVGPRHAVLSADETRLYVITEYSNEIFVFQWGENTLLQRISTLSEAYQGISNCSTLCISGDGRYLYAANRGADTIALFCIDAEGRLTWSKDFSCGGRHPRHMLLTGQNELLIIANQFSNQVTAYAVDKMSGALTAQVASIEFQSPSGIVQI